MSYHLPESLDIHNAETLAGELRNLLAASDAGPCVLHGGAVERVTTPGVQVLLACARSLSERGQPLRIAPMSTALEQALLQLGLTDTMTTWR